EGPIHHLQRQRQ
nr:immunoglobulin heavy chain junction region [Homo sapiens]